VIAERLAHPRFAGIADLIARVRAVGDGFPSVATIDRCFAAELATAGVRLVEEGKTKLALGSDGTIDPLSLYEVRIVDRGEIATRPNNVHDLMNALIWAAFPHAKRALTMAVATIQRARARGQTKLPSARSREHDRLAMIDEGGIVHAGGACWIFGHAIYEHAYAGELGVRGIGIDVAAPAKREAIDRELAALLADPARLAAAIRGHAGASVDDALLAPA